MAQKNRILRNIFRFTGFWTSMRLAVNGIAYLFVYHRNMRIIFLCGITAALAGIYLRLRGIELAALCISVTLVFIAEIFNTAVEIMLDMTTRKYHTLVKLVKDISAAVVLVASVNSVAVGVIIFLPRIIAKLKALAAGI
ncbi:MAG: diacylglycerol kinase family protein [Candidatus Omnitrophota bacterium]|jgi:diacylglycerol kinase|nr:diacylglycerol kinase family protein [Candidatus Omnitrophota bacterium]